MATKFVGSCPLFRTGMFMRHEAIRGRHVLWPSRV